MKLCIEFQEDYKALDKLCKECLSSDVGVTEYINLMDATPIGDRRLVPSWDEDYKKIKHIRWVRNQLAHEVGAMEAGICGEEELTFVKIFYNRMFSGNDPLTLLRKAKEQESRRVAEAKRMARQDDAKQENGVSASKYGASAKAGENKPKKKGWLSIIVDKVKKIF